MIKELKNFKIYNKIYKTFKKKKMKIRMKFLED